MLHVGLHFDMKYSSDSTKSRTAKEVTLGSEDIVISGKYGEIRPLVNLLQSEIHSYC